MSKKKPLKEKVEHIHNRKQIKEHILFLRNMISFFLQKKTVLHNQLTVLCAQYEECVALYGESDQMCQDILTIKQATEQQLEVECSLLESVETMIADWNSNLEITSE